MEKILRYFFIFFTFISVNALCQDKELRITGKYENTPFDVFVKDVENQIPVKFMYHPLMVDSITVTAIFNNELLQSALKRVFPSEEMHFFINRENQIIVTEGYKVQSDLPLNFFDRTGAELSEAEGDVINFLQQEEQKTELQKTMENTVIEIGSISKASSGKTVNLAGYIRDSDTGEPLIGALIYIDNPRIGVSTDHFGYYSIDLPKGRQTLLLQCIGYKNTKRPVMLHSEGKLDINMVEDVIPLKEVVIESEKDINISGMQMGVERLDAQTMKKIPPILGEVDVLRITLSLPGVQSVGEGANGINVRGGNADQNLMLLNDAVVYNPTHLFGFFSAFNPDVIKSVELHKGGIPAEYGGRISSVFEVQTKEGNDKKFVGSGGISPVTARLAFEGPIVKDKASYIVGGRSTYSDWLMKQIPNDAVNNSTASFYDLFAKISYDLNDKNSIYASGYYSHDNFGFNSDTIYSYTNQNASFQWKHIFNNKLYGVFSGLYSGYEYEITNETNEVNAFAMNYSIQNINGKMDFSYFPNTKHKIDFGISSIYYDLEPSSLNALGENSLIVPIWQENEQGLESAFYIGDKYDISPKLSVYLGLRYSLYNYLGPKTVNEYAPDRPIDQNSQTGVSVYENNEVIETFGGPEIRFSARYVLNNETSLKLSYNKMRQYIHILSNTTSISPTDTWKLSDKYFKPQVGDQISLGIYRNFKNNTIEGSIEGYYKTIDNLLDYKSGAQLVLNEMIEADIVNGDGKAYGVEFLLQKKTGKLNGWLSYTYSQSLIKVEGEFAGETINNGNYYPTSYDKPHAVNLLSNWKFSRRLSISGVVAFSTGRPITYPTSKYTYQGTERLQYSERNQYRVPNYFRMDLSLNLEGNHKVKKLNHSSWTFAVYNITGRDNAYSVYFVSDNGKVKGYQLSIFAEAIPTITYNFRF